MATSAIIGQLRREGPGRTISGLWAMRLTIVTEACFFAYLLFSYYYLWSITPNWTRHTPLDLTLAIPETCILVASSGVMWWAERGIRKGNQMQLRIGLLITLLMGVAFLILESLDWANAPFSISSDAFGSSYFTTTGFHGAHVIVGLLMNVVLQVSAWRGAFTRNRYEYVTNASWYWHFVDTVWVFVFLSFYVLPRIW